MSEETVEEATAKIREAAAKGNVVVANPGAENVFPLNFTRPKGKPWTPDEFEYIGIRGAWGKREYPERPFFNNNGGFSLVWGVKGFGFGELSFRLRGGKIDPETGELVGAKLECDSEMMSRGFVKAALAALAEQVLVEDEVYHHKLCWYRKSDNALMGVTTLSATDEEVCTLFGLAEGETLKDERPITAEQAATIGIDLGTDCSYTVKHDS